MSNIYSSPLRVYLLLGLLTLCGIFSGLSLPISLFPNSTKPEIYIHVPYGSLSSTEFLDSFGRTIESSLQSINGDHLEIEKINAFYEKSEAKYEVYFKWGAKPDVALNEVRNSLGRSTSSLPSESKDRISVEPNNEDGGFFAATFYSESRPLDDVYKIVESTFGPDLSKIPDANEAVIWNSNQKEIQIELKPDVLASMQLLPVDIYRSLQNTLVGLNGGSATFGDQSLVIVVPKQAESLDMIERLPITLPSGSAVQLGSLAKVELTTPIGNTWIRKTSGASSILLVATPKMGGNIKKMSEDLVALIDAKKSLLPPDIKFRLLVEPSEFIRSSIFNVFKEVAMAAGLAVFVLFLFIGSFKNVATAAIEIPMSLVMAFILMRISGMNLNMISLGGLALSAGMNVDASVVVMENIFRHFSKVKRRLNYEEKLQLVCAAVSEVKLPIIASTIASLVVFLPLIFTQGLGAAILGDLAKAVIFSHGLSAIVALILVPTVRLQMLKGESGYESHSKLEPFFVRLENFYEKTLGIFLNSRKLQVGTYLTLILSFILACAFLVPRLPQEVIGRPDSDWIMVNLYNQGNTLIKQMEALSDETEARALDALGEGALYTFIQINGPNRATLMFRLRDKTQMGDVWKKLEALFPNTPATGYTVMPWNPSELPLPWAPHLLVSVRGGTAEDQARYAKELKDTFEEKRIFPRLQARPGVDRAESILFKPDLDLFQRQRNGRSITMPDLADLTRVATRGKWVQNFTLNNQLLSMYLKYPDNYVSSLEDLQALPVGLDNKIVPLKAFGTLSIEKARPTLFRENQRDVYYVSARLSPGEEGHLEEAKAEAYAVFKEWKSKKTNLPVIVNFEEPNPELKDSISQLSGAIGMSLILIFFVMVMQLGSVMNSLLVFVSVPLGILGAFLSLWIFGSTISLNSLLGIILLNGIAVANSIILVDFFKRLLDEGYEPKTAALVASKTRLRPILMTSLTTALGMLPVALGRGEGGKILQPLGIAVTGGLWFSMLLTLFVVPALQMTWIQYRQRKTRMRQSPEIGVITVGLCLFLFLPSAKSATLKFDEALGAIMTKSEVLETQRSQIQTTDIQKKQSWMNLTPVVNLEGRRGQHGESRTNFQGQTVSAQVNIFKFGSDYFGIQSAEEKLKSSNEFLKVTELREEDAACALIFKFISLNQQVLVTQKNLSALRNFFSVAEQRYDQGYLSKQELDKVFIDLSNAQALSSDLETDLAKSRRELQSYIGEENTVELLWPWKKQIITFRNIDVGNRVSQVVTTHPEIVSQIHAVASAEETVKQYRSLVLPSLDLRLSQDVNKNENESEGRDSAAMLILTIPLYNRFTDYYNYRLFNEAKVREEILLRKTQREISKNLLESQDSFTKNTESALLREKTLEVSTKLYDDNLKRFKAGRTSVNDLVVDQDRLNQALKLADQGWTTAHQSLLGLCHSLGHSVKSCFAQLQSLSN